jgi:hypothetical protein
LKPGCRYSRQVDDFAVTLDFDVHPEHVTGIFILPNIRIGQLRRDYESVTDDRWFDYLPFQPEHNLQLLASVLVMTETDWHNSPCLRSILFRLQCKTSAGGTGKK